jgi:hypothetical protein
MAVNANTNIKLLWNREYAIPLSMGAAPSAINPP